MQIVRSRLVGFSPAQLRLPMQPFEPGSVELFSGLGVLNGSLSIVATAGGSVLHLRRNWSPIIALGLVSRGLMTISIGAVGRCNNLKVVAWDELQCNAPPGTGIR